MQINNPVLFDELKLTTGETIQGKLLSGTWDMDASPTISVAHGVGDKDKILMAWIQIRDNADTKWRPLIVVENFVGIDYGGWTTEINDTTIDIGRVSSASAGIYDNANYNNATYRIFIFYIK